MKRTHLVAALALAFMLGIATPVLTLANSDSAYATSESAAGNINYGISTHADTDGAATEFTTVSTEAELKSQIKSSSSVVNIQLANDIEVTGTISIVGSKTVTIDLNGHNITSTIESDVFNIWGADVTFTGNGTINASSNASYGVIAVYDGSLYGSGTNNVTIGSGVTVTSGGNKYAVSIFPQTKTSATDRTTVNINGTLTGIYGITINGQIQDASKAPTINIANGATINVSNLAVYAAGVGNWNIGSASITGGTAIAAKAGSFTINNATITANGTYNPNPSLEGNGINSNGVVFQIEHNTGYADNISIDVNGGTYTSANGTVFHEYGNTTAQSDIDITAGTFTAGTDQAIFGGDTDDLNVTISGGTFRGTDVTDFAENGYLSSGLTVDANGTVVSTTQSSTPSSSSSRPQTATYTSADGKISVTGKFSGKITVDSVITDRKVSLFGNRKYTLYDIKLTDASGKNATITSPVTVTMKVPTELDGAKSSIYYVRPDLNGIERLASSFADGTITFTTSHFSYYAIVEDNGQLVDGATENQSPSGITNPSQSAPDTGVLTDHGIISAVATILPLVLLGGLSVFIYSRVMIRLRRAEIKAEIEAEAASQPISEPIDTTPETPVDNFLATPMTKLDEDEIRSHIFDRRGDE